MAKSPRANRGILSAVKASVFEREFVRARTSNYFIQEDVFTSNQRIPIPLQDIRVERPTIMAFADDAPRFNWAHPCRYLLHDAESGELYREIPAQFPPYAGERDTPRTFSAFHESVVFIPQTIFKVPPTRVVRPIYRGTRYAVLFSGMSNNRHTNDLEFLYRTLRSVYNVPAKNIFVLNHDGTLNYDGGPKPASKWPGDNSAYQMPVHGKGSKADLLGVLDDLKKRLGPNDSLLIHTNNHGGHTGTESTLCCYPNWDSLGVKEFTDKLATLPNFRCLMVMMEQCHSGGFNSSIISKSTANSTSVASACVELNNSIGGADFDPFARDWIAAMTGSNPYGHALAFDPDADHNGRISAREAFDYANAVHDPYDTPVFNQANNGARCWLGVDLIKKFVVPPLEVELILRKHWPEPDPVLLQRRIEVVLPQLEEIERQFEPRITELQQEYEKAVTNVIRKAHKL